MRGDKLGCVLPEKVVICGIQDVKTGVPLCKVTLESPANISELAVGQWRNYLAWNTVYFG